MTHEQTPRRPWLPLATVGALAALAVAILVALYDPYLVATDTVHLLDGARHLLAGSGYSSNLILFEEQQALALVPVPQTVWPPGFSLAIAPLLALGIAPEHAGFAISVGAFGLTGLLVYASLREVGVGAVAAVACGAACPALVLAASLVLAVLTEPLFTALTLTALYALLRAANTRVHETAWLAAAGVAAGAAISVRYVGIVFSGAVGLAILIVFWRRPWLALIKLALAYAVVPALVTAALFLRNEQIIGSASGRPSVGDGDGPIQVIKNLAWAFADLLGFGDSLVITGVMVLGMGALSAVILVFAVRRFFAPAGRSAETGAFVCALVYQLATLGLLLVLSTRESAGYMNERYLTPLLPFFLVVVGISMSAIYSSLRPRVRLVARVGIAALALAFLAGQVNVARVELDWYVNERRFRAVASALEQPFANGTMADYLRSIASNESPLLDADGQFLAYLLERPVIGLSSALYTTRQWTTDEVYRLVERYGVRYVTYFPALVNPASEDQRNRVFYHELAKGVVPSWLERDTETAGIRVYRVIGDVQSR